MILPFGILAVAAAGRITSLLFYALLVVLVILPRILKAAFRGLELSYEPSCSHVFPEEEVRVKLTFRNPGRFPIHWLEAEERFAYPLEAHGPVHHVIRLPARSAVTLEHVFCVQRRGIYRLGEMRGTTGDLFGFFRYRRVWNTAVEITCFPRVHPVPQDFLSGLLPMGPRRDRRSHVLDQEQQTGMRPYTRGDSFKSISWKTSAHLGEWMVKKHPPVRERNLAVFLDLQADAFASLPVGAGVETAVEIAASLVWAERDANMGIGLWACASSRCPDHANPAAGQARQPAGFYRYPIREGKQACLHILKMLAVLEVGGGSDFAAMLESEGRKLPPGTSLAVVLPRETEAVRRAALRLERMGYKIWLLSLESDPDGAGKAKGSRENLARGRVLLDRGVRLA